MERGGDEHLVGGVRAQAYIRRQRPICQDHGIQDLTLLADEVESVPAGQRHPGRSISTNGHSVRPSPFESAHHRTGALIWQTFPAHRIAPQLRCGCRGHHSRVESGLKPRPLMKTGPDSIINSFAPVAVSTAHTHPGLLSSGWKKSIPARVWVTP